MPEPAGHDNAPETRAVSAPHLVDVQEVAAQLATDLHRGLSEEEARARLVRDGPNLLAAQVPIPAWRRFLAQFQNPLVILLVIAAAISTASWAYEQDAALPYEALAIFAVVLLNATMGYVQEARAEAAVAALRSMTAAEATVIRDGQRHRLPGAELVAGDVILLEEGNTVPADARLSESASLQTAEAALTGESQPVDKHPDKLVGGIALADRQNMVFSGTAITHGHATAIVTATGMRTEMGRIAGLLSETTDEATPLQRELSRIGKRLGLIVVVLAGVMIAAILLTSDIRGAAMIDVLILGVAIAVAAVPEGLPAVVTAVLSMGVQRMAKRKAIVRNLAAVEALGSASIVASDKTGTLTRNEMTVRVVVTASGRVNFAGSGYAPEGDVTRDDGGAIEDPLRRELERALSAADLANNAELRQHEGTWTIEGDPTEGALLVAARKAGLELERIDRRFERVGEVPFSSERKLMSTLHRDAEQPRGVLFTKGAPDVLLGRCEFETIGGDRRPLTPARIAQIREVNEELAGQALRTLGVAVRSLPQAALTDLGPGLDERVEQDLVFAGLIGLIDPPRPEARDAIARAQRAGIRPVMITGDHPRTAGAIAQELGLTADGRTASGADLERMDADELERTVAEVSVYARVAPEHKLRLIDAFRRGGAIVAMTGDGVNDAPALKKADIGVAMGITGTDVSKEAADIVLADDNFATIVSAVEEGRAIFANIQKFLRYLLSSNIGEVLTMFLAVLFANQLGLEGAPGTLVMPLLATQILWINLVTDGLPALALGIDPPDPGLMDRPPRPAGEGVVTPAMWRGIAFVGIIMAAGTLYVFDAALPGGLVDGAGDLPYAQTMAFTTLTLFQMFNVLNARSDERSAFHRLFTNPWMWLAIAGSAALQVLVVYTPALQRAFGTTGLTMSDWVECVVVASSVLWLREASKLTSKL